MAQSAKFIDVTRTYLPIDPEAFPLSLHGAKREDDPESRVPVMAYKGYNFLPTSYGYKSYFGTAKEIGIDALTARIDRVFIYQNLGYENILIALTDTGIWTKVGSVAGAWTNNVPMARDVNENIHYDWTSCIIANNLYCYRQGQPSYQKMVHNSVSQFVITSVVPSFLNMVAQVGIFRAAGRLAFWDSASSVGWANQDDFADFVPSLETLAGNALFPDIQGRIVTILPHGPGFIIYCTKSIIYLQQNIDNAFQWKPTVILPNAGISYPFQATIASPDTLHFAYTSEGLKKIENAREETIVPEVTDYLKDYTFPVYLRVLEGRYLFLELLDERYVTGLIQISDEVVPSVNYVFPGTALTLTATAPRTEGFDTCIAFNAINEGKAADSLPGGSGSGVAAPVDAHPTNPAYKPVWMAYLSRNGVMDVGSIVWSAVPCATVDPNGVEKNHCPSGLKVTQLTQDSSNKVATSGASAYVDGIWTMERFMQTQMAIWKIEDNARKAVRNAYINRASSGFKITFGATATNTGPTHEECTIGRYANEFTAPKFGYSVCSFWLTRFCITAFDLIRVKSNSVSAVDKRTGELGLLGYIGAQQLAEQFGTSGSNWDTVVGALHGTEISAASWSYPPPAAQQVIATNVAVTSANYSNATSSSLRTAFHSTRYITYSTGTFFSTYVYAVYQAAEGYRIFEQTVPEWGVPGSIISEPTGGRYENTENMYAYNKALDVETAPYIESAYCELTGWNYTTAAGGTAFVGRAGTCMASPSYPVATPPAAPYAGGSKPASILEVPIDDRTGSLCGKSYTAATVSGVTINWPTQTVTIPSGSFLLQLGSNAPVYPTFEGALVYDLQLKKWGKMKLRYKQLLDYSPINSTLNGVVPSNTFGIMAGAIGGSGKITLFDTYPEDSYISYGKVGYYRLGKTSPEEVKVQFRTPSTGQLRVETSLEGRNLSTGLAVVQEFTNSLETVLYGAYPGKWANIQISGQYDICYLEYRGLTKGRR